MTENFFLEKSKGFSMIELLIVMSIISILSGFLVSGYFYYKKTNDFGLAVQQTASMIRKARLNSISVFEDSQWSVNIQTGQVIIFKGTDFSGRDQSFDETIRIRGVSNISGLSQIEFSKVFGIPQNSGSLTLSNDSENRVIQINEEGIISY